MIDINREHQPPCTQFEIKVDWETIIQPKDKPMPYLILILGIIFTTLVFVITVNICQNRISIVMPLNQPRDLESAFLVGYYMSIIIISYIIKQ